MGRAQLAFAVMVVVGRARKLPSFALARVSDAISCSLISDECFTRVETPTFPGIGVTALHHHHCAPVDAEVHHGVLLIQKERGRIPRNS